MLNSRTCEVLTFTSHYLLFFYLGTYVLCVQYKGLAGVKLYLPMRVYVPLLDKFGCLFPRPQFDLLSPLSQAFQETVSLMRTLSMATSIKHLLHRTQQPPNNATQCC